MAILRALLRKGRSVRIQVHQLGGQRGKLRAEIGLGQQHLEPGIPHHEREALLGVLRVERDVCAARLHDSQQPLECFQRPLDAQADQRLGPHPQTS